MDWTPIEKKLPKPNGSYWVTYKDGTVHLGYMKPDGSGFRAKDVIAWMPYPKEPKPYKPPRR